MKNIDWLTVIEILFCIFLILAIITMILFMINAY